MKSGKRKEEKSMANSYDKFNNDLAIFAKSVEETKSVILGKLLTAVNEGELSKLQAIELINTYELLAVAPYVEYPEFMNPAITMDYYERTEVVQFYHLLLDKDDFDTEYKYARFSDLTQDEAINITYDFMIENRIRGCHFDW